MDTVLKIAKKIFSDMSFNSKRAHYDFRRGSSTTAASQNGPVVHSAAAAGVKAPTAEPSAAAVAAERASKSNLCFAATVAFERLQFAQ